MPLPHVNPLPDVSAALPDWTALVSGAGRAALATAEGEVLTLRAEAVADRLRAEGPPLVVHAPSTWRRLGLAPIAAYDLLELFAFVAPAEPAVPTPRGLALALGLEPPRAGLEAAAAALPEIAETLLRRLQAEAHLPRNADAGALAAR